MSNDNRSPAEIAELRAMLMRMADDPDMRPKLARAVIDTYYSSQLNSAETNHDNKPPAELPDIASAIIKAIFEQLPPEALQHYRSNVGRRLIFKLSAWMAENRDPDQAR